VAEIQSVEILLLADPAAFLHQFTVHQRDLPCRPAKAEAADAGGYAHQFGKSGWEEEVVIYVPITFPPAQCRPEKATLGLTPGREVALSRCPTL
jgi:hypothetical protein